VTIHRVAIHRVATTERSQVDVKKATSTLLKAAVRNAAGAARGNDALVR
jgi:hypothetical protein